MSSDERILPKLNELLETCSDAELKTISSVLKASHDEDREGLIRRISFLLNDKITLIKLINRLVEKEFLLLKKIIRYNGMMEVDYGFDVSAIDALVQCGLIFRKQTEDREMMIISDEVFHIVRKIRLDAYEDNVDNNNRVYNLMCAMVELYGIVSIYEGIGYYNRFYRTREEPVDNIDLEFFFSFRRKNNITVYHEKNRLYFIHTKIRHNEGLWNNIKAVKKKYAPVILDRRTLLKYRDPDYYEVTEDIWVLTQFMLFRFSREKVEKFLIDLVHMFKENKTSDHIFSLLEKYDMQLEEEDESEFYQLVTDAYKTMRLWINSGYTLEEMINIRNSL